MLHNFIVYFQKNNHKNINFCLIVYKKFSSNFFLQTYWSDNAVSCTVTFQDDESKEIAPLLRQYRHIIKSTSLLPYYGGSLKQAPKEPINKEKYEEAANKIHGDVEAIFMKQNDDQKDLEIVGQSDCEGGACPIK